MNNCARLIIIFSAVLLLFACVDKNELENRGETFVKVDDCVLTLAEFSEFFEPLRMDYGQGQDNDGLRKARLRFLLQIVEEMIILRRAEELGLHVTDQELKQAMNSMGEGYGKKDFENVFMKRAISFETWEKRLRMQLLIEKTVRKDLAEKVDVTPEEIRDYCDKHSEQQSHGKQVQVRQILLSTKKQAEKVLAQIKEGGDFAALARLYSTAPESSKGGDIGYVSRGELPEALEKAIFSLQLNKVSPVTKTPYGYHIIKAVGKRLPGKIDMDEWIDEIREKVKEKKVEIAYGPWLAGLRSRYEIVVNKEII